MDKDKDGAEYLVRMIAGKWRVQLSRRRRKNIVFTLKEKGENTDAFIPIS